MFCCLEIVYNLKRPINFMYMFCTDFYFLFQHISDGYGGVLESDPNAHYFLQMSDGNSEMSGKKLKIKHQDF